jgi:hypothetical protein
MPSRRFPCPGSVVERRTADAARGAATIGGGWRRRRQQETCVRMSRPHIVRDASQERMRHADKNLTVVQQSLSGRRSVPAAPPARSIAPSSGGVSNPPVLRPCRPEAGPGGCSRPGVGVAKRCRNGGGSARRLRVRCVMRTRCRSRTDRAALSTLILRRYSTASAIT